MDDFSGVGSGMQALVAALSSFVPKKKSHTILLQFIIILQMIQHLNEKWLVIKIKYIKYKKNDPTFKSEISSK